MSRDNLQTDTCNLSSALRRSPWNNKRALFSLGRGVTDCTGLHSKTHFRPFHGAQWYMIRRIPPTYFGVKTPPATSNQWTTNTAKCMFTWIITTRISLRLKNVQEDNPWQWLFSPETTSANPCSITVHSLRSINTRGAAFHHHLPNWVPLAPIKSSGSV